MTRRTKMKLMSFGLAVAMTLFSLTLPTTTHAENVLNISIPTNLLVFVPCANGGAGEYVALSGDLHVTFNLTLDNAGGVHVKSHAQPQGISGQGSTTGDKYQAMGVTQYQFTTKVGEEETLVNNFWIIGQGSGNNFLMRETIHVTINSNGDVTAFVNNLNVDCK